MTDKPSVLVVVPCYGQMMTAHTGGMLYEIAQALTANGIKNLCLWFSMCDVVEARNVFLTRWYDDHPEFSHVLWIDNDMHAPAKLVMNMLSLDKDVTGVFYRRREDGDLNSVLIGHTLPGEDHTMINGFLRVAHVGFGIALVKRSAVTRMMKKFPEINDCAEVGNLMRAGATRVIRAFDKLRDPHGQQLSEDYSFCERLSQSGGEVWANIDFRIDHIGPQNFPLRFMDHVEFKKDEDDKGTSVDAGDDRGRCSPTPCVSPGALNGGGGAGVAA